MERDSGEARLHLNKSQSHCRGWGGCCMTIVPSQGHAHRSTRFQEESVFLKTARVMLQEAGATWELPTGVDYKSVYDFSQNDFWNL